MFFFSVRFWRKVVKVEWVVVFCLGGNFDIRRIWERKEFRVNRVVL